LNFISGQTAATLASAAAAAGNIVRADVLDIHPFSNHFITLKGCCECMLTQQETGAAVNQTPYGGLEQQQQMPRTAPT
jgi:hypothetical protein